MPTAILVSTAVAVLGVLSDNKFSQEFEPVRSYADWELPLEDSDDLHVDVVPVGSPDMELETRGSIGYAPQVDIVIRKRLAAGQQEADGTLILRLRDVDVPRTVTSGGQPVPRVDSAQLDRAERGWGVDGRTLVVKARTQELRIE